MDRTNIFKTQRVGRYCIGSKAFIAAVKKGTIKLDVSKIDLRPYNSSGIIRIRPDSGRWLCPRYKKDNTTYTFVYGPIPTVEPKILYVLDKDVWVEEDSDYHNTLLCRGYYYTGEYLRLKDSLYAGHTVEKQIVLSTKIATLLLGIKDIMGVVCRHMDIRTLCCFSIASKCAHKIASTISIATKVDKLLEGYTLAERACILVRRNIPYTAIEALILGAPIVVLDYYRHLSWDKRVLKEVDPCLGFFILMENREILTTFGGMVIDGNGQLTIEEALTTVHTIIEAWKDKKYIGKSLLLALRKVRGPEKKRSALLELVNSWKHPIYKVVLDGKGVKLSI